MISHLNIGTDDIVAARRFFNAASGRAGWEPASGGRPLFLVGRPHDGCPATAGNGGMVAFLAHDRATVDDIHRMAMDAGGTDEGSPGIHQPELQRPLRREGLPGKEQLHGALAAGEAGQPLGAAEGGRHAEADLRLGEHRALAGDGEGGGLRHLAAAVIGEAVDRHDDGLAEGLDPRRDRQARNTSIAMAQSSFVTRVSMVDLAESRPAMNHRKRRKGIPIRFPHG